jgi:hypothetical protein
VRTFRTIEELRLALHEFRRTHHQQWLVERHGHRTPAEIRRGLAADAREAARGAYGSFQSRRAAARGCKRDFFSAPSSGFAITPSAPSVDVTHCIKYGCPTVQKLGGGTHIYWPARIAREFSGSLS